MSTQQTECRISVQIHAPRSTEPERPSTQVSTVWYSHINVTFKEIHVFRNGDTKPVTFCNRSLENYFSLYVIIRYNVYQQIFLFYFIFETGSPYVTLADLKL